ncbi:hypothetical protein TELCIR_04154 [Teladorsagia circumcincta]|uniref:ERAP1-like C-terminal domain-containing protein n=1 Tax=Teladorsagia circumcincta TaxID=45464 RepID=A0A2G9UUE8_TELCI|nr:hypothetical protein TELCIR_04154 [Teladorsagia circumcincta]
MAEEGVIDKPSARVARDASGFPLITVRSVNGSTFEITQERYEKNPALPDRPKYNRPRRGSKWDVPLWYQINHEPSQNRDEEFLLFAGGSLYISADTANTIIVVNAERYGLYRQNYDVEGWKKIGQQLLKNHTCRSEAPVAKLVLIYHDRIIRRTRNAIISDAFAAALAGRIDYKTVLDLIRYLKNETEYVPWQAAINGLIQLRALIGNAPVAKIFRLYIRRVLGTIYKNDFFDDLSRTYRDDSLFFDNKLKARAIEFVCESGATDCTDKYAQLFKQEVLEKCEEGMRASNCVK